MPVSRDADKCKVTQVSDMNGVPNIHSLSLPQEASSLIGLCNSEQSICLPLTVLPEQSVPKWAFANRNLPNFWWRGSPRSPFQQILGLVRAADFFQDDHEDVIPSVKPSDRHLRNPIREGRVLQRESPHPVSSEIQLPKHEFWGTYSNCGSSPKPSRSL